MLAKLVVAAPAGMLLVSRAAYAQDIEKAKRE